MVKPATATITCRCGLVCIDLGRYERHMDKVKGTTAAKSHGRTRPKYK